MNSQGFICTRVRVGLNIKKRPVEMSDDANAEWVANRRSSAGTPNDKNRRPQTVPVMALIIILYPPAPGEEKGKRRKRRREAVEREEH